MSNQHTNSTTNEQKPQPSTTRLVAKLIAASVLWIVPIVLFKMILAHYDIAIEQPPMGIVPVAVMGLVLWLLTDRSPALRENRVARTWQKVLASALSLYSLWTFGSICMGTGEAAIHVGDAGDIFSCAITALFCVFAFICLGRLICPVKAETLAPSFDKLVLVIEAVAEQALTAAVESIPEDERIQFGLKDAIVYYQDKLYIDSQNKQWYMVGVKAILSPMPDEHIIGLGYQHELLEVLVNSSTNMLQIAKGNFSGAHICFPIKVEFEGGKSMIVMGELTASIQRR